mgnify:CR=1 FL=1
MSIVLYFDADTGEERIRVDERIDIRPLLEEKFIILDACVIFPAILPRRKRNVQAIKECIERLHRKRNRWTTVEKCTRRQIELVNSIEDGRFQRKGYYFGVTDTVFDELYGLGKASRQDVKKWFDGVKDNVYQIYLPLNDFRKRYKTLSDNLSDDGDFSVAIASYSLGSPFASEDYWCFDRRVMKIFGEMYRKRWGMKRKFEKHDSESLIMRLKL